MKTRALLAITTGIALTAFVVTARSWPPDSAGAVGQYGLAIDCDVTSSSIQSNCPLPLSPLELDVYFRNDSASAVRLGAFNFDVVTPDQASISPDAITCVSSGLDCNPDFNDATVTGTWACFPPAPSPDRDPSATVARSFISCFNSLGDGPVVGAGSSLKLARVRYSVVGGGTTATFTLDTVQVFDDAINEVFSCNPTIALQGDCVGATAAAGGPTSTPTVTHTPTVTLTPTPTDTATPTPIPTVCPASSSPSCVSGYWRGGFGSPLGNCSVEISQVGVGLAPVTGSVSCTTSGEGTFEGTFSDTTRLLQGVVTFVEPAYTMSVRLTYPLITPTATSTLTPSPTLSPTFTMTPTPFNPTVTKTPTSTYTGTVLPRDFRIAVDCDDVTVGIQDDCSFPSGTQGLTLDVVLQNNSGADRTLSAFNFDVSTALQSLFQPVSSNCFTPGLDCNPNFNDVGLPGTWSCVPPAPSPDRDADPAVASSFISCFDAVGDGPTIANGETLKLASISYNVVGDGETDFRIELVQAFDASFGEILSCDPRIDIEGDCLNAHVLIDGATVTPTPTATPCEPNCDTPTPTDTPTATPTLPGGLAGSMSGTWDCDCGSGSVTMTREASASSQPISSGGGGILVTAKGDTVNVAPNALPENTVLTSIIQPLPVTPPEGLVTLARAYDFGPDGIVFSPSATAVFHYSPADLTGSLVDPASLQVYVFDSAANDWVAIGGVVDTVAMTITVELGHFSTYAVFGLMPTVNDADADAIVDSSDNCAGLANQDQSNADQNFRLNIPFFTNTDHTWLNSDELGNACDLDDDNDGIADAVETGGSPCPSATGPTNPLLRDTDGDRFLDGPECALGTNPNSATSKPNANLISCGPAGDADGDRIASRIEYCYYNSSPSNTDTDGDKALDGAKDGCEAASFNGDRIVNVADMGMLATGISHTVAYHVNIDVNKDGVLNPADQGLVASFISPAGQCPG